MEYELERVNRWIDRGSRSSHGNWNIYLIGHAIGLLAQYQHYPDKAVGVQGLPTAAYRDHYQVGLGGVVVAAQHVENITFNQIWNKSGNKIALPQLTNELTLLRSALVEQASEPDHFIALGEVAAAEKAAGSGDGPNALQHLKNAGAWVWDVATKIGVGVATAAAKNALGI
jgi:hypothetical protein